MGEIKSESTSIQQPVSRIFGFLSDFNNFRNLMPDQVTDWQSTADTCSFQVSGIGQVALRMTEKIQDQKIVIVPDAGNRIPFAFELVCNMQALTDQTCTTDFRFIHQMPAMIAMMASRPLQNLVDIFGKKLKEFAEKPGF